MSCFRTASKVTGFITLFVIISGIGIKAAASEAPAKGPENDVDIRSLAQEFIEVSQGAASLRATADLVEFTEVDPSGSSRCKRILLALEVCPPGDPSCADNLEAAFDACVAADSIAAAEQAQPDQIAAAVSNPSSCLSSGDVCGDGLFCNHPGGNEGNCVICPLDEEHCGDFDEEAAGTCQRDCFEKGTDGDLALNKGKDQDADGGPALEVGMDRRFGNYPWCKKGGCCFLRVEGPRYYACGCGWYQQVVWRRDPNCRARCGYYADNCA